MKQYSETNRDDVRLLPCPFCGRPPSEDLIDTVFPSGHLWRWMNIGKTAREYLSPKQYSEPHDGRCFVVQCPDSEGGCGVEMHGDSIEDAVARWNRRPV